MLADARRDLATVIGGVREHLPDALAQASPAAPCRTSRRSSADHGKSTGCANRDSSTVAANAATTRIVRARPCFDRLEVRVRLQLRQRERIAAPGLQVDRLHQVRVMEQPLRGARPPAPPRDRERRATSRRPPTPCASADRETRGRPSDVAVLLLPRLHRARAALRSRDAFQFSTTRRSSLYGFS